MADRDNPTVHAKPDETMKQPLSPQNEGIDPLTEANTLLPRVDDKGDSERVTETVAKVSKTGKKG